MLPPRLDVDPVRLAGRLRPGLRSASVRPLGAGWDNVAYAVGSDAVLRVSKVADEAERGLVVRRDVALLELVGAHLSTAVPRVLAVDEEAGALLLSRVPGVPVEQAHRVDVPRLGAALGEQVALLQTIDLAAARSALSGLGDPAPTIDAAVIEDHLATTRDVLDAHLANSLTASLNRALPIPDRITLCHNDLGDEHILVDSRGRLSGILDWSDAVIGDPALDLALIRFDLGRAAAAAFRAAYRPIDRDLADRSLRHAARAGLQGLAWRVRHTPDQIDGTLARLRDVVDELVRSDQPQR